MTGAATAAEKDPVGSNAVSIRRQAQSPDSRESAMAIKDRFAGSLAPIPPYTIVTPASPAGICVVATSSAIGQLAPSIFFIEDIRRNAFPFTTCGKISGDRDIQKISADRRKPIAVIARACRIIDQIAALKTLSADIDIGIQEDRILGRDRHYAPFTGDRIPGVAIHRPRYHDRLIRRHAYQLQLSCRIIDIRKWRL